MFKQYVAIVMLCISNLILVGHLVIPHDHSEIISHDHSDHHHHHGHDHGDKNDSGSDSKGDLSDIFSFVAHYVYVQNDGGDDLVLEIHQHQDVLTDDFQYDIHCCEEATIALNDHFYYFDPDVGPPELIGSGLRAPPVFFRDVFQVKHS